MPFLIEFSEPQLRSNSKWVSVKVRLGKHTELVRANISIWSTATYLRHWKSTAASARTKSSELVFCTSLEAAKDVTMLWPAVATGPDHYRVFNCGTKASDLSIEEGIVTVRTGLSEYYSKEAESWSSWIVSRKDIVEFAEQVER